MEYDFEDPNFDFAGNAEIIAAKLRRAREMQNAEAPQGVRANNTFAMSAPDIGGAIQRGVGRYEQAQAERARGSMNTEQLRRYDELSRGLNEMKPIDYSNPDEAVVENSRRQGLAGQMAKLNLPMAQKAAEIYLNKGAAFPETMAKARMEQIERGEQNALRLKEIEAQKERDRISREEMQKDRFAQQEAMARLGASLRPGPTPPSELDIALKEERLRRMREPTAASLKADAKAETADVAKNNGLAILNQMEGAVDKLDALGGITRSGDTIKNFPKWLANTESGQVLGRAAGTEAQTQRNVFKSLRLNLLDELRSLKGLTAGQMNSNVELQTRLQSLGDTVQDRESLKEITGQAKKFFGGLGGESSTPTSSVDNSPEAKEARYQAWKKAQGK